MSQQASVHSLETLTPDLHNMVEVDDIVAYEYLTHHGNWKWGVARIIRLRGKRSVDVEAWDAVGLHTPAPVSEEFSSYVSSSKGKEKMLSPSRGESMPSGLSGVTTGLWECPPDMPGCAIPLSTVICVLKHAAVEDVTFEVDNKIAQSILRSMWCQRQPLVIMGSPSSFPSPLNSITNRTNIVVPVTTTLSSAQTEPPRPPTVPAIYGYIGVTLASAAVTALAMRYFLSRANDKMPNPNVNVVCTGDSCVLIPAETAATSSTQPPALGFAGDNTAVAKPSQVQDINLWSQIVSKLRKFLGLAQ